MKHVSIFFVILSVFINYSCTDESQNNLLDLEVNASAITRSLAPPNFEQDWENQTSIQLTDNKVVDLPWVEYKDGHKKRRWMGVLEYSKQRYWQ